MRAGYVLEKAKAVKTGGTRLSIPVKATVTVKSPNIEDYLSSLVGIFNRGFDDIIDLLGKSLLLELVSEDLDRSKFSTITQILVLNKYCGLIEFHSCTHALFFPYIKRVRVSAA